MSTVYITENVQKNLKYSNNSKNASKKIKEQFHRQEMSIIYPFHFIDCKLCKMVPALWQT